MHAIYYATRTLDKAYVNHAITEKELLDIVYAIHKFHSYLEGLEIIIYTNHTSIMYLLSKKDVKPKLIRLIMLLQEFDLGIWDKKEMEKMEANHLCRLNDLKKEDFPLDDSFFLW